jgi:hypothetical protein
LLTSEEPEDAFTDLGDLGDLFGDLDSALDGLSDLD